MEPTIDLDTEFALAVAKLEQAKVTLEDAKEAASKVLRKRHKKCQPGEQGEVIRIRNNTTMALNMAQKHVDELQDLLMRGASSNSIESPPASGIKLNGAIRGLNPDTPQNDSREFNVSQPPQRDNGVDTHNTTSHQTPAMLNVECNANTSQTPATILGISNTTGEQDSMNEVASLLTFTKSNHDQPLSKNF
ncbi:hypothetical protein BDQ12DRAFT_729940 [Crucibulum laeve]|uniref:Uncharacterized protein n=1 Tax=Crucibulum laeve TaxID=68775 RepID=A0A5C3LFW3_9AGAR|nr:hypothetical protein BDQ12DRAFT_729940 [Crucibulum laeve]